MAYLEVRGMDIDQIIRRWLAGEKIRGIARSTGADRNTVRRIVRIADKEGIGRETPWPDEGKLQVIRQRMGRAGHLGLSRADNARQRVRCTAYLLDFPYGKKVLAKTTAIWQVCRLKVSEASGNYGTYQYLRSRTARRVKWRSEH